MYKGTKRSLSEVLHVAHKYCCALRWNRTCDNTHFECLYFLSTEDIQKCISVLCEQQKHNEYIVSVFDDDSVSIFLWKPVV